MIVSAKIVYFLIGLQIANALIMIDLIVKEKANHWVIENLFRILEKDEDEERAVI